MLPDTIAEDVDTNTVFAMGDVPEAEAVPVKTVPAFEEGTPKFTKVEIVCKESKLEALKAAMMNLGNYRHDRIARSWMRRTERKTGVLPRRTD